MGVCKQIERPDFLAPMAGIDPTLRAWAGGDLEADQPRVRHFHILEETSEFLSAAGGGRAIGFFGSVEQTEHTIFLTVAKQLVDDSRPVELRPLLGRANIGRGTSGATVYLSPRGSVLASNGSAVPALLLHEYRVPQLPGDTAVVERWRRLQGAHEASGTATGAHEASGTATSGMDAASSTSSALPTASEMWHSVLEAEALSLHRFLERGALPDVTQLAPNGTMLDTALDVLMESAHTLGLLLLPPSVRAGQRRYLERRLGRIAARESPFQCPPAAVQRSNAWLPERMVCAAVPPEDALRFAVGTHSKALTIALSRRLRVPPAALPDARLHARFVMAARPVGTAASTAVPIAPKAPSAVAALSAAATAASSWRVRAVVGEVDESAMESVVEATRTIRGRQGAGGRQGADPARASTREPEKHEEL